MFKFLKEKLKSAISKISESIKEEGEEEIIEEVVEEKEVEKTEEEPKKEEAATVEEEKEEIKEEVKPIEETPVIEKKVEEKPAEKPVEKEETIEKEEKPTVEEEKETKEEEPEEKKSLFKRIMPFTKKKKEEKPVEEIKEEPKKEEKVEPTPIEEKTEIKETQVEEPKEEQVKEKEEVEEKKPVIEEKEEIKEPETPTEEVKEDKPAEEEAKPKKEETEEKKGIFAKIKKAVVTKKINEKQFEDLFWDMELSLLENNVAVEVIEKIKNDLKEALVDKPLVRGQIENEIINTLKSSIDEILEHEPIDLFEKIKEKKPYIICFVGINGSGKTTTIAKMTNLLKNKGFSCCLAAADTFRAAAIDQLALHAEKLGVKMIKHDYGADPAAVAFDAIKHAEAKNIDVVLIDTAGRIHSNVNLQDEMKKIIRIANPDMKIFVGESITGNDCIEQAKKFDESINIDAIILSKADIDEKGGAALSISYVTKKPIIYLGVGQEYNDLEKFNKEKITENLGL